MAKSPSSMRRMQSVVLRYGLSILSVATALSATFMLQPYVFRMPFFFLSIYHSEHMVWRHRAGASRGVAVNFVH